MTTLKATPHKHAALIKQWADNPSVPVWFWSPVSVVWGRSSPNPSWSEDFTYALGDKPTSPPKRMCVLAGVEFPAPETEAPKVDSTYYRPDMADLDGDDYIPFYWEGDEYDYHRLNAGLVHLTKEAAQQHAKALLAANKAAVSTKE